MLGCCIGFSVHFLSSFHWSLFSWTILVTGPTGGQPSGKVFCRSSAKPLVPYPVGCSVFPRPPFWHPSIQSALRVPLPSPVPCTQLAESSTPARGGNVATSKCFGPCSALVLLLPFLVLLAGHTICWASQTCLFANMQVKFMACSLQVSIKYSDIIPKSP
jgi:hypothetical protein